MHNRQFKLYWVTTACHSEDWFVVSKTKKAAEHFFVVNEGMDLGDAFAKEILTIPKQMVLEEDWATDDLLVQLGATFISPENTFLRVLTLDGVKYAEGMMDQMLVEIEDDKLEKIGLGRLNGTIRVSKTYLQ